MPLPRRTAVRLLTSLLLGLAIAGGLWWLNTPKPLNETEKQLVGVWESPPPPDNGIDDVWPMAVILLPDRHQFVAFKKYGRWSCFPTPVAQWRASKSKFSMRQVRPIPSSFSLAEWREYAMTIADVRFRHTWELAPGPDGQVAYVGGTRSEDAELLAIFDSLSAGGSP